MYHMNYNNLYQTHNYSNEYQYKLHMYLNLVMWSHNDFDIMYIQHCYIYKFSSMLLYKRSTLLVNLHRIYLNILYILNYHVNIKSIEALHNHCKLLLPCLHPILSSSFRKMNYLRNIMYNLLFDNLCKHLFHLLVLYLTRIGIVSILLNRGS